MKRFFKKALALLLTVIMLVGVAPLGIIDLKPDASAKTIADCSVGDTITFGSYPQSKVTDSSTIAALNSKAGSYSTWVSYGYYSGTGTAEDGNMAPSDYMKYKDVTYNGVKYRGVYFTAYRPYWTSYTSSSSYSEQDDNGYYTNTAYWFKYEPLTWRVLDPSEGFVMCNKAIDSQAYQNVVYYNGSSYYNSKSCTNYASDWATSSIREWLNNDFYNTAFTASEKSKIGTSYLENKSTYSSKYDSPNTNDKIFLLSYWDVKNSSYGFNSDTDRQIKSTDYAQAQGCYKDTSTSYYGNSWWRLRSPYYSYDTAYVYYGGYANDYYRSYVRNTNGGVVPAFKFNPKSTISSSDIEDVINETVKYNKGEVTINFKNSWFEKSPYGYNHDLARFCANYSMLGYESNEESLKGYLKKAGFNDFYSVDPNTGRNEVNHFIASRDITVNGQVKKLLFVGTIGSNNNQWYSNFDPLGYENQNKDKSLADNGKTHRGFADAREYIYQKLSAYVNEIVNSGVKKENIKILFTGHSRGAATANLLAAKLIDNESSFGISKENIYTYTFATPNVTKSNICYNRHNSIFNIVNPEDFVTKVMLTKWGFSRYGITYTLPSETNINSKTYKNILSNVKSSFLKYTGKEYDPYKKGELKTYKVIKSMGNEIKNVNQLYTNKYMYKFSRNESPFVFFKNTLIDALVNKSYKETIDVFIKSGTFYKNIIQYFAWPDIDIDYTIAPTGSILATISDIEIAGKFRQAHQMETYVAFMENISKSQLQQHKEGYKGTVNCPVDVEVYDKETGELVGRIVNNTVDETVAAKENSIVMLVEGDSKQYWLPSDGDYEVKLIGNDDGKMDYTLETVDSDLGETQRINFFDVEIDKGVALTGETTSEGFVLDDYTLTHEDGSVLTPTEQSDSISEYKITTTVSGEGTATESLSVSSGDYVSLYAIPADDNQFLGWYDGETLVSKEAMYSFVAKSDVQLTAAFAPISKIVKAVTLSDITLNYKKSATLKPQITADDGASYTVSYTSSNPKVASVDENGNVKANKKGTAVITVTVTDEHGNTVTDTCNVKVNYNFGQWLLIILLFGWIWYI